MGVNRGFMVFKFHLFLSLFYFTTDVLSVVSFVIQRRE